jgi:hypothetical protein
VPIDHPEGLENPVAKWTVVATMVALVLLIGISIWAAFSIRLDTFARIDEGTDRIHIRGTETKFVGYATARYAGRDVLIEGLPTIEQLQELPLAWRALCGRSDAQSAFAFRRDERGVPPIRRARSRWATGPRRDPHALAIARSRRFARGPVSRVLSRTRYPKGPAVRWQPFV